MTPIRVSIGRAKRDISDLVNWVAYGGERIVLTSRGRPKAATVSIEDYEHLKQDETREVLASWENWLAQSQRLSADIMARREGRPFDVDALWNVNPDSPWTFILFGGPGYSWVSTDIGLGGAVERSGFTLNGGAGLKISISDRIYRKLAGLARWFERREADDIDGEITLAAGFRLGG